MSFPVALIGMFVFLGIISWVYRTYKSVKELASWWFSGYNSNIEFDTSDLEEVRYEESKQSGGKTRQKV